MDRAVPTPDGRTLLVRDDGDPTGRPVFVHLGTPNTSLLYTPHVADARERGIRLICYDRPGYGGSTRRPGRTIADCADDVRTIAAHLGIERMGMWGHSGGGPHTLACAALLPDLVVAAVIMASVAPYDADGLDYFEGTGEENVEDTKLALSDPAAFEQKTIVDRDELLTVTPDGIIDAWRTLVSEADAAALTGRLAEALVTGFKDGLAPGTGGWIDDCYAMIRPWGFDVAAIRIPLQLWQGRQDKFVPFGHGEWLAAHIPGVDAHLTDEDGHLTLYENRVPAVHAWLLERL